MESPHDTNRFRFFSSYLLYMVLKSKIFIECNAKNLTVEIFEGLILKFECIMRFSGWRLAFMKFYQRSEKVCWFLASYQLLLVPFSLWHEHC